MARTKNKNKNKKVQRNSKAKKKRKKGGSKANTRCNEKKLQKMSVVQEKIEHHEDVLDQSEHSDGNSVTQNKTRTGDDNHVDKNIFDDEIDKNIRNDLTEDTVDNQLNKIEPSESYTDIKSKFNDILKEKFVFFEKYGGVTAGNGKCYFNDGC